MNDPRVTAAAVAAGLEMLLELPTQVMQLHEEVVRLREEVVRIRCAIPPALVSVSEAATRLGMSRRTIRRHITQGTLRAVHIGQNIRVDLSSIPQALELATVSA